MAEEQAQVRYTVEAAEAGLRLDRFLAERAGISRHSASRLLVEGQVRVGAARGRKGTLLRPGDVVSMREPPRDAQGTPPPPQPELPLVVLYEDPAVVVVNKPAGQPSHPLRAGERGTTASALVARYPECVEAGEVPREGGLCHRLDVHTSGALLCARSRAAWLALRRGFGADVPAGAEVDKEYLALCIGAPPGDEGEVTQPLLPAPGQPDRMLVAQNNDDVYRKEALDAHTRFVVLRRGGGYSLLRAYARTGRRHQIRAHLAYLGLPLVGDAIYGGGAVPAELAREIVNAAGAEAAADLAGQQLHAAALRFSSPQSGQRVTVEAPLPPPRQRLWDRLLAGERT